ncbi:uncharacterized protein ATC70_005856 [Mucor velutinosus]|uniref:Reverse transcriptase zinc-binding domain-containing protein n=1 Tax=Mucor velutinosus TaxID=708070 RepID=A0AAN7DDI3_9FUNG|nr:hypothetical protein ATC70_005856 [Mucor velutinosus]
MWTLPKERRCLGVVDIQIQASTLYFRWLHPLLVQDQDVIDSHPVSYLLSYHIRNVNGYPHHQIPLLFPSARRTKGLKKQRTGTVDMLYRAVDYLPKSFDAAPINTATAMTLPLQAAFYVPPSSSLVVPLKVKVMMVSDKRAPSTVFRGLASGTLKFQPYFLPVYNPAPLVDPGVSFAPLVDQFCLNDGQPLGNAQASAKTFRLSVLSSMEQPLVLQNISASHWKFFWPLSLTYIQRNVIYRLITGCIPSRSRLHYMMPGVFESHNCPVCLSPNETASHLLFDCPPKEKVWQGVIFEFLWPTTSITDIKEALLSLDFSDIWYSQVKGIHPYIVLLITLSQIWLAHMRFVFDNIILVPEAILVNIRFTVRQTVDEDQIHSLL